MWRSLVAAAVAVGTVALAPSTAGAAWKPFASGAMNISDQVSLARTSDGVLHVGWFRAGFDVFQTPVSAAGTVGAAVPIVSGWASAGNPVLVAQGGALTAFWPGSPTLVTGDPQAGIDMATSADGGHAWAVSPRAVSSDGFASSPAAAAVGGTFLQAFERGSETVVHVGLDPAVPAAGGYGGGTNQALAASTAGQAMVAWCTTGGVFVQPVTPASGAPAGAASNMPGTGYCDAAARTQLVARVRGGFVIAAPDVSRRKVLVWRVGSPSAATIAGGSSFKQQVAMAATPDGRLWAGWEDSDTGKAVFRRSNKTATRWGAAVPVTLPPGRIFQLNLDARRDRVDAVIRTENDAGTVGLAAGPIRPGLTLVASGGKTQAFRVLDAGDPIARATVKVAGRSLTTDAKGRATADLRPGRYTATAAKRGYVRAKTRVHVRPRAI
jgi:hypothetical protein